MKFVKFARPVELASKAAEFHICTLSSLNFSEHSKLSGGTLVWPLNSPSAFRGVLAASMKMR